MARETINPGERELAESEGVFNQSKVGSAGLIYDPMQGESDWRLVAWSVSQYLQPCGALCLLVSSFQASANYQSHVLHKCGG